MQHSRCDATFRHYYDERKLIIDCLGMHAGSYLQSKFGEFSYWLMWGVALVTDKVEDPAGAKLVQLRNCDISQSR